MKKITSKDGTVIAYNNTGKGPALILVDGAMCNSKFGPMPKLVPLLSKYFTVICFDRRGRSDSTDNLPYTPEHEIEDIEALVNEVNSKVCLFGMSSGAILSIMTAAKNSQVEKIALYEPPFETDEISTPRDSAAQYSEIKSLLMADNPNGAVKYFLKEIVHMPSFFISVFRLLPMWKNMVANVSSLPYDLEISKSFTVQKLSSLSVSTPSLIIYGGKSPEILQRASKAVSESIPGSKTRVLKGQTHNVSMKVLAPVLIDFFNA
jgi:pimeloyl-ACP methyl ester carboxylesterase